ncbi:hypothetical protein EWM64_g882 [Hericium alpestre]|uniref:Rho-GAP domain-containing protein n=1 Tax=Hericium alpestre TaxID=135208 RepID=A0A4Z0ABY6_9AGAM|nr:hypothetical protein EWM64_g882 [Hericium alpestre]
MTETPSTSRASLDAPSSGPIPQFDFNLKILTDSYLSFFSERKRVEEVYIDSLTKLYKKVKAIDSYLDDRSELSSTRKAWNEVRDNVERETQARQAFLNTLSIDVLNPLSAFRESQDRTRKRIKEDLKESSTSHNEFAEGQLPKLKRTYLRKCQEYEDYKAMATATSPTSQPATSFQESFTSPRDLKQQIPLTKSITGPQPLRPLERRASVGTPANRNRSPSGSGALSDLAHQGKRQLNQLMTFLDKGGNASGGSRSTENSARAVRAKREAEDADKEYRKAVHWNETLRLRRAKILEAAYHSLERFLLEGAELVKSVLVKYTDNSIATCTTLTGLATHARSMVELISPQNDTSILSANIPRSLASSIPKPILYYNYQVGECRDLVYGVSMVDYATARGVPDGEIPKIMRLCIQDVDARGLDFEGIYRVSGRHAVVQDLQLQIERNENKFSFNTVTDDVCSVASLLKLYLRELPEPVFRFPLEERVKHTKELEHLSRVAAHQDKNKMDAKNLAIVFGTVIFGEDEIPTEGMDLLNIQSTKDSLMEDLIINANILFDDHAPPPSPPLPPAPAGEPVPVYNYGSVHTRVTNISFPSEQGHPQQSSEKDFAPPLPPRPLQSIHPASRTYNNGNGGSNGSSNTTMQPPKDPGDFSQPGPGLRRASRRVSPSKLSTRGVARASSMHSVPSTPTSPRSPTSVSAFTDSISDRASSTTPPGSSVEHS